MNKFKIGDMVENRVGKRGSIVSIEEGCNTIYWVDCADLWLTVMIKPDMKGVSNEQV